MSQLEADFIPLNGLQTSPHESYIVPTTATTLSIPLHAQKIMWQALTQNVRYTLDGTAPTSTKGFQLKAGDPPTILKLTQNNNLILKIVAESAGAVLQYIYGR